jgi:LPS sulfotransferase NodH
MSKIDHPFSVPVDTEIKNTHLELFQRLADAPDTELDRAEKSLVVLSTPRSGSTLFCDVLSRTGLIGLCEEWFNYEYFAAYQKVMGLEAFTFRNYFRFVINKTIGDTGVFAIKMHIPQVRAMKRDFDFVYSDMHFDHSVYLYRKDKIAQAVSLVKAVAKNQFRFDEESTEGQEFDMYDIANYMSNIISQDKTFNMEMADKTDARYAYEDFCQLEENRHIYDSVLKALGKTPPEEGYTTRLKKQGDADSRKWILSFHDFINGNY